MLICVKQLAKLQFSIFFLEVCLFLLKYLIISRKQTKIFWAQSTTDSHDSVISEHAHTHFEVISMCRYVSIRQWLLGTAATET